MLQLSADDGDVVSLGTVKFRTKLCRPPLCSSYGAFDSFAVDLDSVVGQEDAKVVAVSRDLGEGLAQGWPLGCACAIMDRPIVITSEDRDGTVLPDRQPAFRISTADVSV